MKDYICKGCIYNNNGWCMKLKKNGLTKIQECEHVKNEQIKVKLKEAKIIMDSL